MPNFRCAASRLLAVGRLPGATYETITAAISANVAILQDGWIASALIRGEYALADRAHQRVDHHSYQRARTELQHVHMPGTHTLQPASQPTSRSQPPRMLERPPSQQPRSTICLNRVPSPKKRRVAHTRPATAQCSQVLPGSPQMPPLIATTPRRQNTPNKSTARRTQPRTVPSGCQFWP